MFVDPDNLGIDTNFIMVGCILIDIWPNNGISVMADSISIF